MPRNPKGKGVDDVRLHLHGVRELQRGRQIGESEAEGALPDLRYIEWPVCGKMLEMRRGSGFEEALRLRFPETEVSALRPVHRGAKRMALRSALRCNIHACGQSRFDSWA